MKSVNKILFLAVSYWLLAAGFSFSQSFTNSPYSRFGVGELQGENFAGTTSLGGIYTAFQNDTNAPFIINPGNPASHGSIRLTAFEFGVRSNFSQLETNSEKFFSNQTSMAYIALGVPVKKWWGTSLGLMPYSAVGYKIHEEQTHDSIGNVKYSYEGQGGINQLYFGNGFRPFISLPERFLKSEQYKKLKALPDSIAKKKIERIQYRKTLFSNLYIGANISYLFGNIIYSSRDSFPSGTNFFNTKLAQTTTVSDFYFNGGLQWKIPLRKNWSLTLGATGGMKSYIRAKRTTFAATYANNFGVEQIKDTIINDVDVKDTVVIPMTLGGGFVLKKADKWLFGFDYTVQNWSAVTNEATLMKNSQRYALGIQYSPDRNPRSKEAYYKKIFYRAGFRYASSYLDFGNGQLKDYALTFGAGFPLKVVKVGEIYSQSIVNIAVELGQFGTTENDLIKQRYIKATLGFTLNDRWFIKKKYD